MLEVPGVWVQCFGVSVDSVSAKSQWAKCLKRVATTVVCPPLPSQRRWGRRFCRDCSLQRLPWHECSQTSSLRTNNGPIYRTGSSSCSCIPNGPHLRSPPPGEDCTDACRITAMQVESYLHPYRTIGGKFAV